MAIYCMHCGTELPDNAIFCLKCRKPLKDGVASTAQKKLRWEYCEIFCVHAGYLGVKSYFSAQAVDSKRQYEAARSQKTFGRFFTLRGYEPIDGDVSREALREITATLSSSGWQPTGKTGRGRWWEYTFQRQVSS